MFGSKDNFGYLFFAFKVVYNKIGDNMSSKVFDIYKGKRILLYGGKERTKKETLKRLFQSTSDDWSKEFVQLTTTIRSLKKWEEKMEKLKFLTLSQFLKIFRLFQKELYEDHDYTETLELDSNKKLKEFSKGEKERILFLLQYQLKFQVYLFDEPFLHQNEKHMNLMLKLIDQRLKEGCVVLFWSKYQLEKMEEIISDVLIVTDTKIKFEPLSKVCHHNYSIVHLKGKNYKQLKLSIRNIILKDQTEDEIVFLYCGKFHELFSVLQTVELEDVSIRKQTLDEALMSMK